MWLYKDRRRNVSDTESLCKGPEAETSLGEVGRKITRMLELVNSEVKEGIVGGLARQDTCHQTKP